MGFYGLAIFSGVQWIYSFILPYVIGAIGVKMAYLFSQVIATVAYLLFGFKIFAHTGSDDYFVFAYFQLHLDS